MITSYKSSVFPGVNYHVNGIGFPCTLHHMIYYFFIKYYLQFFSIVFHAFQIVLVFISKNQCQISVFINFLNVLGCLVDDKVRTFYTFWCHISDVVYKNIFLWLSIYLDVIRIEIFCIYYVDEKVLYAILDTDFCNIV